MIVKSVGINRIPTGLGTDDRTRVIQQTPISFSGEAKPHSVPRASSGWLSKTKAFLLPLGFASSLALPACDGMEPPPEIEVVTHPHYVQQPDGGATPTDLTPKNEFQIRPTGVKEEITPHYGPQIRPSDEGKIIPHYGPQIRPENEPAIERRILDETGEAIKMLDKDGNAVSARIIREGKKILIKIGRGFA